jgi:hypothetical protein
MDTFLRYLPILPALGTVYMVGRTIILDVRAAHTAAMVTGKTPFWRRPIVVMLVLVVLAWIPFVISLFFLTSDLISPMASKQKEFDTKTSALTTITADRDAEKQRADNAQAQLAARTKARDDAIKALDAARPTPPISQPKWSDQEIATRLDLWHAVQNAMKGVVKAYNSTDLALNQWEDALATNKKAFLGTLASCRKQIVDGSEVIQTLRRNYPNFEDVSRRLTSHI